MTYTMNSRAGGLVDQGTCTPDELLISVEQAGLRTIASGAGVLARGTVLGKITASGKLVESATASADGSQTPYCVLGEDVDATAADAEAVVYLAATLNSNKLIYGAGHSLATVFDVFRQLDIHLNTALPY